MVQLGSEGGKFILYFIYLFFFLAFSWLPNAACPSAWSLRKLKKIKEERNRNSSCYTFYNWLSENGNTKQLIMTKMGNSNFVSLRAFLN